VFGELWRPGGEKEETDLSRPDGDRREWLFTGKEWDVDTELYYFGARYFDPHADVWQSPDPILASYMRAGPNGRGADARNLGLYTYAWNNPVIVRDPTGEFPVRTYPWSPGNLATHQLITRNALWGHVTETVLRQITAANVGVDSDQGVSPESQSKHAMRAIDQDPANAKARWQARVESEFGAAKQALQEDRIDDARNAFGRATHTMQDSNATAHTDDKGGPQVWEGLGEVVKAKKHVDIDMAERSEGARAQRATQQTRALFERLQNEFLGDKPSNKAVETWRKFTGIK
jgi:RHS repeat-associated protein